MTVKLKIFSDRKYLPEGLGHVVMLYPFWGKNPEDFRDPNSGRFDRYLDVGQSLFKMTSLEDADFAVMPFDWTHVIHNEKSEDMAIQFASKAQKAGKKVVIFYLNDSDEDLPIENAVIFRTSFYRSSRKPNEYAMSSWSEDFVMKYTGNQLRIQQKRLKPCVGFCGYSDPMEFSLKRRLFNILRWGGRSCGIIKKKQKVFPELGKAIRADSLRVLSNSPLIETNFIIRNDFFGGCLADGIEDFELMQKDRLEYVKNMVESDYTICARGNGNFSYRLYETLCCGRIPIFIDTDCVLPYDFLIDYSHYFVWIDSKDISRIAEKVNEFHKALSADEFVALQQKCRKLWEDYLSPEGFFENFHKHFGGV